MQVLKRDGTVEDIDLDKLHRVVSYACDNLPGVSISQVEINSRLQFYDKIKSETIQETLIKSQRNYSRSFHHQSSHHSNHQYRNNEFYQNQNNHYYRQQQ